MRTGVLTPGVERKMQKVTDFLRCKKRKKTLTCVQNTKKRRSHTLDPTSTVVENNRELASALSKAKARIMELESEKLVLHGERQELMEHVASVTSEIEKYKCKDAANKAKNDSFVKEISKSLYSNLEKTTEMLLQCSNLLAEAISCTTHLMSDSSSGNPPKNSSRPSLGIVCPDMIQTSYNADAALSLTALTPSISSTSSLSDNSNCLPVSGNGSSGGLKEDRNVDWPALKRARRDSFVLTSTPNASPAMNVWQLTRTREECAEDGTLPLYTNDDPLSSPHVSPSISSPAVDRRIFRRRRVKENFCGYKEPSLTRKLRQGDPYTDCSLFSPSTLRLGKKRYMPKRKNVQKGGNLRKKIKSDMDTIKEASRQLSIGNKSLD